MRLLHVMTLFVSLVGAMPYISSVEPDIDLMVASHQIARMFDRMILMDVHRAHQLVCSGIRSLKDTTAPSSIPPTLHRYRARRLAHLNDCRKLDDRFEDGFVAYARLKDLFVEHLDLLMSIQRQTKLMLSMMYSLYVYDGGPQAAVLCLNYDGMANLLLDHAKQEDYTTWQTFLHFAEEDEDEDEDEEEQNENDYEADMKEDDMHDAGYDAQDEESMQ